MACNLFNLIIAAFDQNIGQHLANQFSGVSSSKDKPNPHFPILLNGRTMLQRVYRARRAFLTANEASLLTATNQTIAQGFGLFKYCTWPG